MVTRAPDGARVLHHPVSAVPSMRCACPDAGLRRQTAEPHHDGCRPCLAGLRRTRCGALPSDRRRTGTRRRRRQELCRPTGGHLGAARMRGRMPDGRLDSPMWATTSPWARVAEFWGAITIGDGSVVRSQRGRADRRPTGTSRGWGPGPRDPAPNAQLIGHHAHPSCHRVHGGRRCHGDRPVCVAQRQRAAATRTR